MVSMKDQSCLMDLLRMSDKQNYYFERNDKKMHIMDYLNTLFDFTAGLVDNLTQRQYAIQRQPHKLIHQIMISIFSSTIEVL